MTEKDKREREKEKEREREQQKGLLFIGRLLMKLSCKSEFKFEPEAREGGGGKREEEKEEKVQPVQPTKFYEKIPVYLIAFVVV